MQKWAWFFAFIVSFVQALGAVSSASEPDSKLKVPSFELTEYSEYLSAETIAGLKKQKQLNDKAFAACNPYEQVSEHDIRECEHRHYEVIMPEAHKTFDVNINDAMISDVPVHIIAPPKSHPMYEANKNRILINLHGGGFKYGGGYGGQLESMPLAHYGGFTVVAIDYKKAPNHRFPAANKDIEKVVTFLLNEFAPENIGIFGCSAGSRIAGQSLVYMAEKGMPKLGAVAFLCSAPTALKGDSNAYVAALTQTEALQIDMIEYWEGLKEDNQRAFPGDFAEQVLKFPPALLITSGRDYSLSPMIAMHNKLVSQGKTAQLHVFEGLTHAQFLSMYIPESVQTANIMTEFFDKHLAK